MWLHKKAPAIRRGFVMSGDRSPEKRVTMWR